ncbi:predicted protein [Nematostella vectensis]|uniref:UBZ1-type domain-containing protein n=2 Tax=Nematostella vectensis TaxID=45351 RepID=A7RGD4_NEMVE|nr:predicted protein [Nematostella vectensis]|eukprot:XP_001641571.1 predicted protein [Nematostella vectensis]
MSVPKSQLGKKQTRSQSKDSKKPNDLGKLSSASAVLLDFEDGDVKSDFKEAYNALKTAYLDVKAKYFEVKGENSRLIRQVQHSKNGSKKRVQAVQEHIDSSAQVKLLREALETAEKEKKELQEKLSNSFTAYKEKYQQYIDLQNTCRELKTKLEEQPKNAMASVASSATSQKKEEKKAHCTHATKVTCDSLANLKVLLGCCGLKTLEDGEDRVLSITDKDKFLKWLNDITHGKDFDEPSRAPSCAAQKTESSDILDTLKRTKEYYDEMITSYERKVTLLKQKIVDQGSELKKLYSLLDILHEKTQTGTNAGQTVSTNPAVTKREKERRKLLELVRNITNIISNSEKLQRELAQQKTQIQRLVGVINRTKQVKVNVMSRIALMREFSRTRSTAQAEKQKEDPESTHKGLTDVRDLSSIEPLSVPVQVSDFATPQARSLPNSYNYDMVPTPQLRKSWPKSRNFNVRGPRHTNTAEVNVSKGQIVPSELQENENQPPSCEDDLSQLTVEQFHDNDDIVVIDDEYDDDDTIGACGTTAPPATDTACRECPMCSLSFSPGTAQNEFEKHVEGHFKGQ